MPQRPPTPEIDDGAKYLTVVNPYPFRTNMDLDSPRKLFAHWIATCLGNPMYLRAFYYKPSSPGCIIMEIDEQLPDFRVLLGLHKWSEFLKDPREYKDTVSRVYYSTFNSDRIVQKNGWKRVDVEEKWFIKPSNLFVESYPTTYYCDIPKSGIDIIQNDLCRPLPTSSFPRPPRPPRPPVVGTPEWQDWKSKQGSEKKLYALTRTGKMSVLIVPNSPSPRNYSSDPSIPSSPPGLVRAGSSTGGSTISDSTVLTPVYDYHDDGPDPPRVGIVSLQSALEALSLNEEDQFDDVLDYSSTSEIQINASALEKHSTVLDEEVEVQSLWADYVPTDDRRSDEDDEDDLGIAKAAEKNPELCKVHHKICKKGICREYAKQLSMQRKRERMEEIQREREIAAAKRAKKQGKKNKSGTTSPPYVYSGSGTSTPTARAAPPHLRPGAPPLPPHLKPGASAALKPSPISPTAELDRHRRLTAAPSRQPDNNDDDGFLSVPAKSAGPFGSSAKAASGSAKPWGVWGAPPSISSSAKQRNNDGWSVASSMEDGNDDSNDNNEWPTAAQARSASPSLARTDSPRPLKPFGNWGQAPSISSSSARRNYDLWSDSGRSVSSHGDTRSVAASEAVGWSAAVKGGGPRGSKDAAKAGKTANVVGSNVKGKNNMWADLAEVELNDVTSVAGDHQTWEEGPW